MLQVSERCVEELDWDARLVHVQPWRPGGTPTIDDAAALRDRPCLTFRQAWRDRIEPHFQPACIWLGHDRHETAGRLYILADLTDRHIHSPATGFNDPRRKEGDFFEILLRPSGQRSYYEFHITPTGCRSQFRFDDFEHAQRLRRQHPDQDLTPHLQYDRPLFDAQVEVDRAADRWSVLAAIDLARLVDRPGAAMPTRWRFAFCRWDVDPQTQRVISSSTSAFTQYNYHRHDEWRRLILWSV